MKTPPSLLPDQRTLTRRLTAAFNGGGAPGRRVRVLERRLPRMMSTYPNEMVHCRLPDGSDRRVFIKYEAGTGHMSFGHRGNVAYEAEIYRQVLQARPGFRPKFLASHASDATGETWLMIEFLDRAVRVSDLSGRPPTRQPRIMAEAARWIGEFHAAHERRTDAPALASLIRYDTHYYVGWVLRTHEYAAPLLAHYPWFTELCLRNAEWINLLLAAPATVIHGEYYAKNVLLRLGQIFVVDWESSAIAPGEIDLAALTEGHWPARLVQRCVRVYQRARWPEGAPADFPRRLDAARIYLHFRWLGERPDWTVRKKSLWRYEHLHAAAARLGLID